ncbi:unnamed protein product [Cuscuta epithymum]|uniref:Uncharacterized protein n=2 Tax=Cuscuta epithymum TaxID=186058 RepID=A0AAV0C0B6_9ASTE|nr:unnamed protein product [Cuscuta epithymum]
MQVQGAIVVLVKLLIIIAASLVRTSSSLKVGETCSATRTCDDGLFCSTCLANGNTRPRCVRTKPTIPTSKVKGLPFNKYSWLTTHNSFARSGAKSATGSDIISPKNQNDSITDQLKNGVRGLMLDMYDFNGTIWLCHSYGGNCYNVTSFEPAIGVLKEINTFLGENPSEIITIFIEDYVTSPQGLKKVFNESGLSKYWFPVSQMPKNGGDWPTVDDMVNKNQRLVVFTSKRNKEATDGIAYEWTYVVENQYGTEGMVAGSCPNRAESSPMNNAKSSLVLQNYFPTNPDEAYSCVNNSAGLISMMDTCYKAAGQRWPNFIAVDFYKESDGGGAAEAVDQANGQLACDCTSIAYCKKNGQSTVCEAPKLSPPPPAASSATDSTLPDSSDSNDSSVCRPPQQLHWLMVMNMFTTTVLLWWL